MKIAKLNLAVILVIGVLGVACTTQTPVSPTATNSTWENAGSSPSSILTGGLSGAMSVAMGNCPGGSGDKDQAAPFSLSGVTGVVVKAGTECYGPFPVAGGDVIITVAGVNCFIVDFTGSDVRVYNHPDHIGKVCKGISHIEASGVCEEGCEPPPPPCEDPKGCEPVDPKG